MRIIGQSLARLIGRRPAREYPLDLEKQGQLFVARLDDGAVPVIYTAIGPDAPLGAANFIGRELAGKRAIFLPYFSWASHNRVVVERSARAVEAYRRVRPEHDFIFLCNTDRERAAHAAMGLDAIVCSHNALVDETVFTHGDALPVFDAVHNAAVARWKRHELGRLVESCVEITYARNAIPPAETMALLAELQAMLPSHSFANPVVDGRIRQLRSTEVAAILRRRAVGSASRPKRDRCWRASNISCPDCPWYRPRPSAAATSSAMPKPG